MHKTVLRVVTVKALILQNVPLHSVLLYFNVVMRLLVAVVFWFKNWSRVLAAVKSVYCCIHCCVIWVVVEWNYSSSIIQSETWRTSDLHNESLSECFYFKHWNKKYKYTKQSETINSVEALRLHIRKLQSEDFDFLSLKK